MNVELKLNKWKVLLKENASVPTIVGQYDVVMNGKSIAEQSFNDGYNSRDVPFSGDVVKKIVEVEKMIVKEIQAIIS